MRGIRIEPWGPNPQVTIKDCRIVESREAAIDIADGVPYEITGNFFVDTPQPWWRRLFRRSRA